MPIHISQVPGLAKKLGVVTGNAPKPVGRGRGRSRRSGRTAIALDAQCRHAALPVPVPEYRFANKRLSDELLARLGQRQPRQWAIDWAFPKHRLAVEVEGGYAAQVDADGQHQAGRHTRAKGFLEDLDKYNALACLRWSLIRVTPRDVASGKALAWIQRFFDLEV